MPSLFEMEITKLKGVGEKRAALYRKLGAPTVGAFTTVACTTLISFRTVSRIGVGSLQSS